MKAALVIALVLLALGLGAFSSAMFVWQWIIGPPGVATAALLFALVLAVFAKIFFSIKQRVPQSPAESVKPRNVRAPVVCLLIAVGYGAFSLAQHVKALPLGAWDAWAVWNFHARFLYRGGSGAWLKMFEAATVGSNADYPLLLPGLVSGAWTLMGA